MQNCGLKALEGIVKIKNISMYTLIHLAKDNGINFYFCKVDADKLPLVQRPAIFHSDDHFTLVIDEQSIPKADYSGWVLTPKPMGTPLSYSLAKQVVGGKKGGVARFIVPALVAFIPGIGPGLAAGLSAGSNIAMDQYAKSNHPEQLGQPGKFGDIVGAGFQGAMMGVGAQGGMAGFKAASSAPGATLASKAAGFGKGAFNAISHPIASLNPANLAGGANTAIMSGAQGGFLNAAGKSVNPSSLAGINNAAGAAGLANYVGASATKGFSTGNIPGFGGTTGSAAATGAGGAAGSLASGVGGFLGGAASSLALSGLASQIGKPDTSGLANLGTQTANDYSALKTYTGLGALGQPTQDQLMKYVNTPLDQLTNQMSFNSGPVMSQINKSFDQQIQNAQRAFAQSNQTFDNSSDVRNEFTRINNERANAIKNAEGELRNQAMGQAIQTKQFALAEGLNQNQFDMQLAMDLATLNGQGKALQASIANDDYNQFQNIIANLLHIGYQQNQPIA